MDSIPSAAGPRHAAAGPGREVAGQDGRTAAVTALYREHALGLVRLAHLMLGNRQAAEDVVQEAFCGLYRRWPHLTSTDKALAYVRSAVLNGCRTALRRRAAPRWTVTDQPPARSAEAAVLATEEQHAVVAAVRRLPDRQREALVLRFYLDLPDTEIAAVMGIGASTVRANVSRGLAALGIALKES